MVQYTGGSPSFKLLLLQDAFKVLHPLLQVPHVSWQVTVEKAHRVAKNCHPRADAPFIPLRVRKQGQRENAVRSGSLMRSALKLKLNKSTGMYQPNLCSGTKSGCFFSAPESQNQRARQPAAALTSKRRRLHQQQRGVMLTSTCTGRSHTDIWTHARCWQEGAHTPPFNLKPPTDTNPPQILRCDKSQSRTQSNALQCTARTQYPPSPVRVLSVCTPLRNGRWQNLEKTSSSTPCIRWDAT